MASYSAVMRNTPTLYYRLSESSGTNATDSSGNGSTGTYAATGITYSVASPLRDGSINNAVTFSGVGQVAAPIGVVVSGNVTVMVWFKASAISGNTSIMANYSSNVAFTSDFGVGFAGSATNQVGFLVANTSNAFTSTPKFTITASTWVHLAGTYDTTSHVLSLYANGALVGTNTEALYSAATGGFFVGSSSYADYQAGSYDEAVVYSKVLTADQIKTYYQQASNPTLLIKRIKSGNRIY